MSNKKLSLQDTLRGIPESETENALHPVPATTECSESPVMQESTTQQMYRIYKHKFLVKLAKFVEYYF